ncbi:hypothetical protein [Clostridium sp.]|uniref:hypothetical protein n=1 Tax=Clostridium sp. TaxID=1506 RepID=UPI001B6BB587|nr:hypothetical protein [Clostridium sp.]MBP3916192.1 hypothetical protein [Clostridium sp.]
MNKEKIIKILSSNISVGIITGLLCFTLGGLIFSDGKKISALEEENLILAAKCESDILQKDAKIKELEAKIEEAKPWFEMQEEARIAEEKARKEAQEKEAEEKARKEAEEKARKEAEEKAREEAEVVDTDKVKRTVSNIIKKELADQVKNTTIDSLQVNENLGTDSNKDVVVLGNFSWSTLNTEKLTREMLEMYSDHLSAKLAPELADGSEIAFFWKAEYTGLDIKHTYTIKGGSAYKSKS